MSPVEPEFDVLSRRSLDIDSPIDAASRFRSVGRRFTYALIGVVTVLLTAFAITAILLNIRSVQSDLELKLNNTLNLSTVGLRTLMWNVDNDAIKDVVQALFLDPAIVYARVQSDNQDMASHAREGFQGRSFDEFAQSDQFVAGTAEIHHTELTGSQFVIGTMQLAVSRAGIRRQILLNVAGIVALTILVISAIAFTSLLISRRYVARPLSELQRSATLIAGGKLDTPIDGSSPDEIGLLARDLNTMRESIQYRNTQLEDINRTLEQRVAGRTAELAQAIAEINTLNEQLKADNLRMGAELEITRRVQKMLLPADAELKQVKGMDIAGHMEPADEVGGDYYDVLQHDGRIKIGIGDVTGHGLESGVMMVMAQCVVRALLTHGESNPVRFLDTLNRTLYGNVQRMGSDKNMSISLLDYADGEVKLSGQHESIILMRCDGEVEVLDTIDLGFPIGLVNEISDFVHQTIVQLKEGDGVVLYTDGITEAENIAKEQYGLERLCKVVQKHWAASAEAIKEAVVTDVTRHIGQHVVFDDITLVVAKQL